MASECKKCGNKENYNFALNIGLCNSCIGNEVDHLRTENKEKQELIDALCSEEPCPKCGYGVTGQCYGCIIKQLRTDIVERDKYIKEVEEQRDKLAKALKGE